MEICWLRQCNIYGLFVAGSLGMFVRRIASQLLQLQSLLLTVLGLKEPTTNAEGRADLVRDQFGLHKMIVAVTSVGKVMSLSRSLGHIHQ